MKTVGIPAINARMKAIASQFGTNSEVYKRAKHYLEANISDKYLKKDKVTDEVIGIRQTKEALKEANMFARPEALNEYVPSVKELILNEKNALLEDLNNRRIFEQVDQRDIDKSYNKIMADPYLRNTLFKRVEQVYSDLNDQKGIVDEVYHVKNNDKGLNDADYISGDFKGRANELVDQLQRGEGRDRDWMREARYLVDEYEEKCKEQDRQAIRKRTGK